MFRVDGSHQLGIGHVVRCLVLAKAFRARNVRPVFIVKEYEPKILGLIAGHGFSVKTISCSLSMEEDASATSCITEEGNAACLVVDVANLDYAANENGYIRYCRDILARTNAFAISLDDHFITDLPFDIRIIPYCGVEKKPEAFSGKTKWLIGPAYFIFQEEFKEAARVDRTQRAEVNRILITMGGSDPFHSTEAALACLNKVRRRSGLEVRVIIGPGFSIRDQREIGMRAGSFHGTCRMLSAAPGELAQQLLWTDIAITAGGLTKYEAAVTGTPNIIMAGFSREVEMCRFFSNAGASLCIDRSGKSIEEELTGAVETLMEDYDLRVQMSRRGKKLVDGCGVDRILSEIPSKIFS